MREALIIETGDILDIKFQYKMMNFRFSLPEGIEIDDNSLLEKETYVRTEPGKPLKLEGSLTKPGEDDEKRTYYILSDGKKYYENELIIGLNNIREYKIKNIIE